LALNRLDLVSFAHALHPKEFETMELDLDFKKVYSQLDPKERERIDSEWEEVFESKLPRLALTKPNTFKRLLASVDTETVIEALGTEKVVKALGTKKVIEALGMDALADELTDERLEKIARLRQAKKQQQEPTP